MAAGGGDRTLEGDVASPSLADPGKGSLGKSRSEASNSYPRKMSGKLAEDDPPPARHVGVAEDMLLSER